MMRHNNRDAPEFIPGWNGWGFTTPKEAVMQALKKRGETPDECSPNEIAKETGMPLYVVLDMIAELLP